MQTILGSGGAIGNPLAKELKAHTNKIRLVARNPKKVNEDDELFVADLVKKDVVNDAVAGCEIVYLTVGLLYNSKVWQKDWPVVMRNVIDACIEHKAKLVFLDNVYMYSPSEIGHMTEKSKMEPGSKKGKVRLKLVNMIFDAIKNEGLIALIARSADFYGPNIKSSVMEIGVFDKFKKNQKAFWQADASKIHSFTFTPDAAKAVAILGNTPDAYNQVWHLPTSSENWTGKDFIETIAKEMNVKPRYYILSKFMISLISLFSSEVKELKEMQYQNDRDYFFDSKKFNEQFTLVPTSYSEGIKEIVSKYSL
jgi:nucleoside-diphosphate-sugar epimerase